LFLRAVLHRLIPHLDGNWSGAASLYNEFNDEVTRQGTAGARPQTPAPPPPPPPPPPVRRRHDPLARPRVLLRPPAGGGRHAAGFRPRAERGADRPARARRVLDSPARDRPPRCLRHLD